MCANSHKKGQKNMNSLPSHFAIFLILALLLSGCEKKEEPVKQQDVQPVATSTAPVPAARSLPTSDAATAGFDVNKAPVVNPQLGKFPYVGLIEGYKPSAGYPDRNKDAAFDKYEFYDGAKLIPVEGRLKTIEAGGKGASAFEIFKTYESLVTGLGGVKVYEGKLDLIWDRKLTFTDERHRKSVL